MIKHNKLEWGLVMEKRMMDFILGVGFLAAGLFMVSRMVMVTSWGWGSIYIGGFSLPSGLVVVPLLLGIGMYVYNYKSIFAKFVMMVGVICILASVIMSVRIHIIRMTLFDYVLMFGLIAAGAALLLRHYFKKN